MMREHGKFEIRIHGRVVFARLAEAWNLETCRHYAAEILAVGERLNPEPWAVLTNVRDWQLGPPEIRRLTHELTGKLDQLGRTHAALVFSDNKIVQDIVREARTSGPSVADAAFFDTESAARAWLVECGFGDAEDASVEAPK